MKLSDIFTKKAISARPEDTLAAVAARMREHHVGAVVIAEERRPVGIVTDRDLALALGARGLSPQTPAREVMTRSVLAIPDDADVFTATKYIRECEVRRLPIVDREDRLVGMVTLDDLLGRLGRELCDLAEGIRHEAEVK
jgi:CBS domain-containing protein